MLIISIYCHRYSSYPGELRTRSHLSLNEGLCLLYLPPPEVLSIKKEKGEKRHEPTLCQTDLRWKQKTIPQSPCRPGWWKSGTSSSLFTHKTTLVFALNFSAPAAALRGRVMKQSCCCFCSLWQQSLMERCISDSVPAFLTGPWGGCWVIVPGLPQL